MKTVKQLMLLLVLILAGSMAYGQAGIRVGVNLANQKYEAKNVSYEPGGIVGSNAALVYNMDISALFSVQPELHFIQKGSQFDLLFNGKKTTLNYLELAVAAKVNVVKFGESTKVYAAVTPSIGYLVTGTINIDNESDSIEFDEGNNRIDYGIGLGAGAQFGSFFIDLRYNIGLAHLSDNVFETVKNNGILIGLGYMF